MFNNIVTGKLVIIEMEYIQILIVQLRRVFMRFLKSHGGSTIVACIIAFLIALLVAFFTATQVKSTSTVEFCNSCHEMHPFYKTWAAGKHGVDAMGAVRARCVDCHLPHDSLANYLTVKTQAGLHDMKAHAMKKKTAWLEIWKNRGPYVHEAYESGCKECHKKLVAPGIPVKAFTAHKAYLVGQTKRTCIDCHHEVGHGDLVTEFREIASNEKK